jgi:hypothetical protein
LEVTGIQTGRSVQIKDVLTGSELTVQEQLSLFDE